MKRVVPTFLFLILTISSCQIIPTNMLETVDIPLEFDTIHEAWLWVATNINYQVDRNWPHPEKVYNTRLADCKGYSVLLAYFIAKLGYTPYIIVYEPDWASGNYLHAVVYVEELDSYLEPQMYNYYEVGVKRKMVYTIDQVIYIGEK